MQRLTAISCVSPKSSLPTLCYDPSPSDRCKENRVRENGSKTSDAVCFETVDHFPPVTMTPGLKAETISLSARNMSLPPQISTPTGLPHEKVDNRRNHGVNLTCSSLLGILEAPCTLFSDDVIEPVFFFLLHSHWGAHCWSHCWTAYPDCCGN